MKRVIKRFLNFNWVEEYPGVHNHNFLVFETVELNGTVIDIKIHNGVYYDAYIRRYRYIDYKYRGINGMQAIEKKTKLLIQLKDHFESMKVLQRKKKYFANRFKNIPTDLIEYIFKWI